MIKSKTMTDSVMSSDRHYGFLFGEEEPGETSYTLQDMLQNKLVPAEQFLKQNLFFQPSNTTEKSKTNSVFSHPTSVTYFCQICNSDDFIVRDQFGGSIVCSNCGQVLNTSVFDHNPEWNNYDEDATDRCGLPTNALLPHSSLGTSIHGNCNYRLRTLHNWGIVPYKERSLNSILNIIRDKCSNANLKGCIENDAKVLYKIAIESKGTTGSNLIIRGKNRVGLIAACIYYACKRGGQTKSYKEIAKLFNIPVADINKGCKNFTKYVEYKKIDYKTNLSYPSQYIQQFCEKLKIDKKIMVVLDGIAKKIQNLNIAPSHTPISVASACILLCAEKYKLPLVTKETISNVFDISNVTLSKTYNKIIQHEAILFRNEKNVDTGVHDNVITPDHLLERLQKIKLINTEKHQNMTYLTASKYLSPNRRPSETEKYHNLIAKNIISDNQFYQNLEQIFQKK